MWLRPCWGFRGQCVWLKRKQVRHNRIPLRDYGYLENCYNFVGDFDGGKQWSSFCQRSCCNYEAFKSDFFSARTESGCLLIDAMQGRSPEESWTWRGACMLDTSSLRWDSGVDGSEPTSSWTSSSCSWAPCRSYTLGPGSPVSLVRNRFPETGGTCASTSTLGRRS